MTRRVEFFRHDVGPEELDSVAKTIGTPFLSLGPRVTEFEAAFAEYIKVPHVIGVSSCSMGLLLLLKAFDIGAGDEVITTPMTFVATSNAIIHAGARPVFADIDISTGLLRPDTVESAITSRTKAIIVVHLYGQLADMKRFREIADRHHLVLIEDAAHAITASARGIRVGELGDGAAFSFYATKEMTSGDGGAVAVHDATIADKLRRLRNHGMTADAASRHATLYRHWDVIMPGFKAPMTDIEAAFLLPQISKLEGRRAARQAIVEKYESSLQEVPGIDILKHEGVCSHHLFAMLVPPEKRDAVLMGLGRRGVGCAVNYRSIHTLKWYREHFGFHRDDFPDAALFGERTISLPCWAGMVEEDVRAVIVAVRESLLEAGHT